MKSMKNAGDLHMYLAISFLSCTNRFEWVAARCNKDHTNVYHKRNVHRVIDEHPGTHFVNRPS